MGEGVSMESIDGAMLEFGMPMGPLRLIDEVGIDVAYDVAHELAEAFKERMTVAPALQQVHEQGLKGRKGGAGFYIYKGKAGAGESARRQGVAQAARRTGGAAAGAGHPAAADARHDRGSEAVS